MKYKRMLCWVRPHEKKELKKAVNGQFPLVFTRNFSSFKRKIQQNDYVVISCSFVEAIYDDLKNLIKSFPKNIFIFYDRLEEEDFSIYDVKLTRELQEDGIINIVGGLYKAKDVLDNFLGIIPDLEKDLLENYHLEWVTKNGSTGVKAVHNSKSNPDCLFVVEH